MLSLDQAREMFYRLGIGPGNSLLGGIAVLFIPIPFVIYYVSSHKFDWLLALR